MTNTQRIKNDEATIDKREIADNTIRDSRNRNDELTMERRFKVDRTMDKNRLRNDELTINRREIKDGNPNMALAIVLLILVFVIFGAFAIFV